MGVSACHGMGTRVGESVGLSNYIDPKMLSYSINPSAFIQQILQSLSCDGCAALPSARSSVTIFFTCMYVCVRVCLCGRESVCVGERESA